MPISCLETVVGPMSETTETTRTHKRGPLHNSTHKQRGKGLNLLK